ncbi:hypothetical protein HWV62_23024 [Athelia sp. TMB]|nr:hypothetical protein HWV62_23024 [Athelia sp. TMB]
MTTSLSLRQPSGNSSSKCSNASMAKDESRDPYHSKMQGILAITGLGAAIVSSAACIGIGMWILGHSGLVTDVVLPPGEWRDSRLGSAVTPYTSLIVILPNARMPTQVLNLFLIVWVAIATECIGFVHNVALKSTLASEGRLAFNTNSRLFSRMKLEHWRHPNGPLFNTAMGLLLILSYAASSLAFSVVRSEVQNDESLPPWRSTCVFGVPLTILGISVLLQASISTWAILRVNVLTWSSSPLDTSIAMLRRCLVTGRPGRRLHTLLDDDSGAVTSRGYQPSVWQCRASVKKIAISLWLTAFACVIWGGPVYAAYESGIAAESPRLPTSLDLIPTAGTWAIVLFFFDSASASWFKIFALLIAMQAPLTFGLHSAELVVNSARDESQWRKAATPSGASVSSNPVAALLGSWPSLTLFLAKPLLHWLFALSMNLTVLANPLMATFLSITVTMRPIQIWYLAAGLIAFTTVLSALAIHRSRGAQPAAFGQIQTLVDAIDVWSPRIWWTNNEIAGQASNSEYFLPPIACGPNMSHLYEHPLPS